MFNNYSAPFRIGLDPKLIAFSDLRNIQNKLKPGFELIPVEKNLIDQLAQKDLPARPNNEVYVQPLQYAGKTVNEKLKDINDYLVENDAHAIVITMLDELSWLFNLRGSDVEYNPIFFAYAIITKDSNDIFINSARLTTEAIDQIKNSNVNIHNYEEFYSNLNQLSVDANAVGKKVHIGNKANWSIARHLGDEITQIVKSPVTDAKAIKNDVELQGSRNAHKRDGIALVQYFAWLEDQLKSTSEPLKEYDAALKLEQYRSELDNFKGLSFNTISATGSNGAIIHYSPSTTDSDIIDLNKIYLCDSGAQFLDGTTDITRTYFFGENPSQEQKVAFTRVLQGHIALANAVFPTNKVPGTLIDILARMPLYREGLDYRHGTGHGISSHGPAHEGPHVISPKYNDVTLKNGMLVSNEPGFYKDGEFGIRTESILAVVNADTPNNFGGQGFSTFETLTICPIGINLIDIDLLNQYEKSWLNSYHKRCRDELLPELQKRGDGRAIEWLEKTTKTI